MLPHVLPGTQTQYSKYDFSAKIETIALRNELALLEHFVLSPVKMDYGVYNFDLSMSS